jgi:hypothetical protein
VRPQARGVVFAFAALSLAGALEGESAHAQSQARGKPRAAAKTELQRRRERTFAGMRFGMSLPADFAEVRDSGPTSGSQSFALSTETRKDLSQGMLQISLFDLQEVARQSGDPKAIGMSEETLTLVMLKAVGRTKRNWQQTAPTTVRSPERETEPPKLSPCAASEAMSLCSSTQAVPL